MEEKGSSGATAEIFVQEKLVDGRRRCRNSEASRGDCERSSERSGINYAAQTRRHVHEHVRAADGNLEGRDGTCKFNTNDLTEMLTRWKQGTFSTEDWNVAECQGAYFNTNL